MAVIDSYVRQVQWDGTPVKIATRLDEETGIHTPKVVPRNADGTPWSGGGGGGLSGDAVGTFTTSADLDLSAEPAVASWLIDGSAYVAAVATSIAFPSTGGVPFDVSIFNLTTSELTVTVGGEEANWTEFAGIGVDALQTGASLRFVPLTIDSTQVWFAYSYDREQELHAHDVSYDPTGNTILTGTDLQTVGGQAETALVSLDSRVDALEAPSTVIKSTSESLSTNTTAQDDDELFFAVASSSTYDVTVMLYTTSANAGDIKVGFTAPTGATIEGYVEGYAVAGGNPPGAAHQQGALNSFGTQVTSGSTTAGNTVRITATIWTSATAGTVHLQWAQGTSDATATVVRRGSRITYRKVA